jgi:anti-sigma factor RsiW
MDGELAGAAEAAVTNRWRTADQVPAAEVARWRERIRALLNAKDPQRHKGRQAQGRGRLPGRLDRHERGWREDDVLSGPLRLAEVTERGVGCREIGKG